MGGFTQDDGFYVLMNEAFSVCEYACVLKIYIPTFRFVMGGIIVTMSM
jgi:hypothetical protein